MENFYLLGGKNTSPAASAFAPEEIRKMDAHDKLISVIENVSELPFELTLVKLTITKKGLAKSPDLTGVKMLWSDYLANSQAWPLFSMRAKEIIENCLTGNEELSWISASVRGNNEKQTYYIARFAKPLDVLDMDNTTFVPETDSIIKPVFSWPKVKDYSVIYRPSYGESWKIPRSLYVSEKIKREMQKEKLSRIIFGKTRVI